MLHCTYQIFHTFLLLLRLFFPNSCCLHSTHLVSSVFLTQPKFLLSRSDYRWFKWYCLGLLITIEIVLVCTEIHAVSLYSGHLFFLLFVLCVFYFRLLFCAYHAHHYLANVKYGIRFITHFLMWTHLLPQLYVTFAHSAPLRSRDTRSIR